jgi:PAS domain S-box-containing protein
MAFHSDVQRITRSLNWIGAGALVLGIVVVVWALWWTRGVDDFRTAVIIAALGFGLPSLAALTLAWMLDPLTQAEGVPGVSLPAPVLPKLMYRGMFDWPVAMGYVAAVVAVVIAALMRVALNPLLGESVPFITFFLAVAVAAWIGGFGPSALATALGIVIAWRWQLQSDGDLPPNQLTNVVAIGIFAATALAIGGIAATMRATAAEADRLSAESEVRNAELRAIESELRHERDRIRVTLESIGDAVITTDADGAVAFLNPAAERLTGWRLRNARGAAMEKVVEVIDAYTGERTTLLSGEGELTRIGSPNFVLVDRKGGEHRVDGTVAPIVDERGERQGHVVVFRDVPPPRPA